MATFDKNNDVELHKDLIDEIKTTSNSDLFSNVLENISYTSDSCVNVDDEEYVWLNFAQRELQIRLINIGFLEG